MTHYNDVIMDLIASQITSLTIVYSAVYSGADRRKHQSSASLAFVPMNSPHKRPETRKMFPFDDHDDVIKWKHFTRYWPFVRGIHRPLCEFSSQRPVTRSFDVFFDLRLNKRLSKQSWSWCFETLSSPLWRHSNVYIYFCCSYLKDDDNQDDGFAFEYRGPVAMKGKKEPMECWLLSRKHRH